MGNRIGKGIKEHKIILCLVVAVLFISIALLIFIFIRGNKKESEKSYMLYEVIKPDPLAFSGKVQAAKKQVIVYDPSMGNITEINAKKGSVVKAGDVLVTYSNENDQNNLEEKKKMQGQYNANLENLKAELEMQYQELDNVKVWITNMKQEIHNTYTWEDSTDKTNRISELQLELGEAQQAQQSAETQISSYENSIISYNDQLVGVEASMDTLENTKQTVITATFDGTVRINEKGQTDSSEPVVTVYSSDQIVKTNVTEYDVEKLKTEQRVTLSYVNQKKDVEGTIATIDSIPESDTENVGSYPVNITPKDKIPLGYSVQIKVSQDEIRIPKNAIIMQKKSQTAKEEMYYVFKYEKGRAVKTPITMEEQENYIKVLSGLTIGDKIVENPADIKDQMKVTVL